MIEEGTSVAQWSEQSPGKREVLGSIPGWSQHLFMAFKAFVANDAFSRLHKSLPTAFLPRRRRTNLLVSFIFIADATKHSTKALSIYATKLGKAIRTDKNFVIIVKHQRYGLTADL